MKFLIHVIDECSKFVVEECSFKLEPAFSESQEPCEIQRSDCFYHIEAKDFSEALIEVAQKIKILNEENEPINLAYKITENYKKLQSSDVGLKGSSVLDPMNFIVSNITSSNLTTTMCQVERSGDYGDWIENHKIYFYVLPVNKIVDLK